MTEVFLRRPERDPVDVRREHGVLGGACEDVALPLKHIEGVTVSASQYTVKLRSADNLAPQCDFSSSEHGNDLTEEQEIAKLRLVVETAQEVWG